MAMAVRENRMLLKEILLKAKAEHAGVQVFAKLTDSFTHTLFIDYQSIIPEFDIDDRGYFINKDRIYHMHEEVKLVDQYTQTPDARVLAVYYSKMDGYYVYIDFYTKLATCLVKSSVWVDKG